MSSTKHPTDSTPVNANSTENSAEPNTEVTELSLLERVKLLKSRQQLSHPDPRGFFKGPSIGNGPRGTRRSMGKR